MIKTNDRIVVELPFPVKILGIRFFKKKKVGFLFTNLALLLFRNNNNTLSGKELQFWIEKHGQAEFAFQCMYYAAIAYNMDSRQHENFTMDELRIAIKMGDEPTLKAIGEVWESSQNFGVTIKKKVAPIKKRK